MYCICMYVYAYYMICAHLPATSGHATGATPLYSGLCVARSCSACLVILQCLAARLFATDCLTVDQHGLCETSLQHCFVYS